MPSSDASSLIRTLQTGLGDPQGPLYEMLAEALRGAISRGEILPGTRLPAERVLAQGLHLSRTTVVLAYSRLRESGHLESRHGSGSWVRRTGKTNWPSPQEHDVSSAFRRNVVFRSLLERSENSIGFVTAHLPPLPAVDQAAQKVVAHSMATLSGEQGYFPMGLPALRKAVANHLTKKGLTTHENEVLITCGAQQGISLLAGLLVSRGETVVTEDPTYIGAIDVFSALGARILAAPGSAESLDLDRLRALLATRPRLLYLVPDYHNPTGGILPERSRREIARCSEELQIPVVEDRSLAGLGLSGDPPPPIAAFAKNAPVVTLGSFSKLFWSGLRVGYLRGPEALIARLGRWKALSDLGTSLVPQAMALALLSEWSAAEKQRRKELSQKLSHLETLLHRHIPDFTWIRPQGGLLLWARMKAGDANDLAPLAEKHGVTIVPGSGNSPDRHFSNYIRIPFVAEAPLMSDGIIRLSAALREYNPKPISPRGSFEVIV